VELVRFEVVFFLVNLNRWFSCASSEVWHGASRQIAHGFSLHRCYRESKHWLFTGRFSSLDIQLDVAQQWEVRATAPAELNVVDSAVASVQARGILLLRILFIVNYFKSLGSLKWIESQIHCVLLGLASWTSVFLVQKFVRCPDKVGVQPRFIEGLSMQCALLMVTRWMSRRRSQAVRVAAVRAEAVDLFRFLEARVIEPLVFVAVPVHI